MWFNHPFFAFFQLASGVRAIWRRVQDPTRAVMRRSRTPTGRSAGVVRRLRIDMDLHCVARCGGVGIVAGAGVR
jgi:hypothetical protein